MKLFKFSQFINEEVSQEALSNAEEIKATVDRLNRLVSLAMIDDHEAQTQIRDLSKSFYKNITKDQIGQRGSDESFEILKKLGEVTSFAALKALSSPGAQALKDKGLYMVSSLRQLSTGNLLWSLDPNYQRHDGWAIGFFPGPRKDRRMVPKGIDIGNYAQWRKIIGGMDIIMKTYPYDMPIDSFFNTAMHWAAENVDFEHTASLTSPKQAHYLSKRTTKSLPDYKYYTKK